MLAIEHLSRGDGGSENEEDDFTPIILAEATIEKPWGWIFFYESSAFLATGDFSYRLAGNAPLIVERSTGRLLITGTGRPLEFYVANYEATGDPHVGLGTSFEAWPAGATGDLHRAAKLLDESCQVGVGTAWRRLADATCENRASFTAITPEAATIVCEMLRQHGFQAQQLPERDPTPIRPPGR